MLKRKRDYFSLFLVSIANGFVFILQPYFYEFMKFSIMNSGVLVGIVAGGQLIGAFSVTKFLKGLSRIIKKTSMNVVSPVRVASCIIGLLIAAAFFTLIISNNFILIMVTLFFLGFSISLFYPINLTLLLMDSKDEQASNIGSAKSWVNNLGMALSFFFLGVMVGDKHILFGTIIFFMIIFISLQILDIKKKYSFEKRSSYVKTTSLKNKNLIFIWLFGIFLFF
jgi:MFS family permease